MSKNNKKFPFKKTFLLISSVIGIIGAIFWLKDKYFVPNQEIPEPELIEENDKPDSEAESQLLNLKLTTEFQRIIEKVKNEPVPVVKPFVEPSSEEIETELEKEETDEDFKKFKTFQSDKENQARLVEGQRQKQIKVKQQAKQKLARERELTRWQNWVLNQLTETDQQRQITTWQNGIINEVQTYWNSLAENDLIDNQTLPEILPASWTEKVQKQTSRVELDKLEQQAKNLIYRTYWEWEKEEKLEKEKAEEIRENFSY